MNKEKLKVLIDSIKTANDLMKKQIEINGRAVELLGEFITEPESIEVNEAINWWNALTNKQQWDYRFELIGHRGGVLAESEIEEIWRKKTQQGEPYIKPDAMYKDSHLLGGVPKDDKAPACLDGKGDATIKPEDMIIGNWYVINDCLTGLDYLFKYKHFQDIKLSYHFMKPLIANCAINIDNYMDYNIEDVIRKAEKDLVTKYFPNEKIEIEPTTIKPEDMKAGEWYVIGCRQLYFLFKFKEVLNDDILYYKGWNNSLNTHCISRAICTIAEITSLRKATQQEILKYFPNELEVDTHGGNDAGYIKEFTDPQI